MLVEMEDVASSKTTRQRYYLHVITMHGEQMDLSTSVIGPPSVPTGLSGRRLTPACHSGLIVVIDL